MYTFGRIVLTVFLYIFFRVKVIYKGKMPDSGGAILASNHISYLDPVLFGYAIKNRKLTFMAKKELFKNKFFAKLISSLGAYPVDRKSARRAIEASAKILREGNLVCIFPEGTRSKDGSPHDAKGGVALIARNAQCDVVPACVYVKNGIKIFAKIHVVIGETISYADLKIEKGHTEELQYASELIMGKIKELWSEQDVQSRK